MGANKQCVVLPIKRRVGQERTRSHPELAGTLNVVEPSDIPNHTTVPAGARDVALSSDLAALVRGGREGPQDNERGNWRWAVMMHGKAAWVELEERVDLLARLPSGGRRSSRGSPRAKHWWRWLEDTHIARVRGARGGLFFGLGAAAALLWDVREL